METAPAPADAMGPAASVCDNDTYILRSGSYNRWYGLRALLFALKTSFAALTNLCMVKGTALVACIQLKLFDTVNVSDGRSNSTCLNQFSRPGQRRAQFSIRRAAAEHHRLGSRGTPLRLSKASTPLADHEHLMSISCPHPPPSI
ncbi:hypothetical protein AK812_SmicGene30928 [Symbiodinium microadriaticum]|uniref:Uncharacterized protein n=1 Tax=Symbiodinium microadriaticum TaxID=2951 RepID=A0A1Q9CY62_SYMMI|nr:hypothetical protein AK812_SmicGene30928 [Symbiodinium microadriaticum]